MQILDVTRPISDAMTVWPGDPPVSVRRVSGTDEASVSRIQLGTHTGTHVDPPAHFSPAGKTVDALPLERLIGPAWVAQISDAGPVTAGALASAVPPGTQRLLLRTANSERAADAPFATDFVALAPDAARWLLDHDVLLVGIDGPSIEPYGAPGEVVHRMLLGAGVIVIENLDLSAVDGGPYQLCCLPLCIAGGDGAPARVVLIRES